MATSTDTLRAVLEFVNKAGPGVKAAGKDLGGLAKTAKTLGTGLAAAGVVAAGKAAYELGVLGAQSLRTKRAFTAISGGALIATDKLDAMRRATRGAMSEQQMMASANRLMQMGLANNAAELEQVTTMATRLGSAMGKEAGPAVEEFALMLANQSIPRLDTFGISAGKVRARILELQAATPGLSREMAFMTATMEEGEEAMGRLGEAVDDELLANERLEASWADLKAMAGEALAPAMANVASSAEKVTRAIMEQHRELDELREEFGEATVGQAILAERFGVTADSLDDLRQRSEDVAAAVESGRSQVDGWSSALSGSAEVADVAAGAFDGLATSAKTVAGSFGEMEFDNEQMWKMAMAAGATLPQLEELARRLGIASSAEIEMAKNAYALAEGLADDTVSVEEYTSGFRDLRLAEAEAAIEARIVYDEMETLQGGMQEAGDVADGMTEDFGESSAALNEVERAALDAQTALDRIERDVAINIRYDIHGTPPAGAGGAQAMQSGTAFHRGGLALIGEGTMAGELVALPRGSRVWPASAPQTRAAVNNRYNYGGDTIIINDRLASALYLESRRRDRMQRIENM